MTESRQAQTTQKIQEEQLGATLPSLVKEINQEIKEVRKIKGEIINAPTEKKEELTIYLTKLKEKVDMILENVTPEKVQKANLAQLAKAMRTFANEMISASGGKVKRSESRVLKVNIDIDGMSKEDLLLFLSKKSQEKD